MEFFENFKAYMESGGDEVKYYTWMIHRSNKMQNQLGVTGIIHSYKPPYQNFAYKNYTVILSMLPDLKHALEDYILRDGVANQYASTIQDTLVRHIGIVEDRIDLIVSDLKNPLKWLHVGVSEIVSIPAYMLSSLGILSETNVTRIISSSIFKIFSGLIALFRLVSSVITVVLGWNQFLDLINRLLTSAS